MESIDETPLVSVIIACYNGERYIDDCIGSLLEQDYENIEIIICDDCSSDGSYSKLLDLKKTDSRITILRNNSNLFAAAARNECIRISKGKYLLIQDIDDYSQPTRVSTLVSTLQENKQYAFVSSAMITFDKNYREPYGRICHKKKYPTKWDFLYNLPFNHPATLFLKEAVLSIGGYEVSKYTRRMEDYDLFMRLYMKGYKGMNIDDDLYLYRQDKENIIRRTFTSRIDEFHIRYRDFSMLGLMPFAFPFILKPFLAHIYSKVKFRDFKIIRNMYFRR